MRLSYIIVGMLLILLVIVSQSYGAPRNKLNVRSDTNIVVASYDPTDGIKNNKLGGCNISTANNVRGERNKDIGRQRRCLLSGNQVLSQPKKSIQFTWNKANGYETNKSLERRKCVTGTCSKRSSKKKLYISSESIWDDSDYSDSSDSDLSDSDYSESSSYDSDYSSLSISESHHRKPRKKGHNKKQDNGKKKHDNGKKKRGKSKDKPTTITINNNIYISNKAKKESNNN